MAALKKENGKVLIEGVRKISWDTGEMCEFASSVVSALNSLGEDIPYPFVMGTSGVAFRFTIHPGQWDFSNYGILNISPDRTAPIRRAFAALGRAVTLCEPGTFQEDAAKIMASIEQGVPVLAFHVVGPSDCCIISGYDQDGEVLLGWSTYQNIPDDHNIPHDPSGYFRKPGWHDNLPGYLLIGPKVSRPPLRAVYLDALAWAVQLMGCPQMGAKVTGLKALEVWAEEMTQEKYFPAGAGEIIGQRYVSAAINLTMLRDHCQAEPFLRQALADVPEFQPELAQAAGCYAEVQRLTGRLNELISDDFSEKAFEAIADPAIRRAYAAVLLQVRDVEQEASLHIQGLLRRCG